MCGRFTQAYTWCELVALYRLTVPATNLEPRYNVVPTTTVETVIARDGEFELSRMPFPVAIAGIRSYCDGGAVNKMTQRHRTSYLLIRMQTFGRQLNMRLN